MSRHTPNLQLLDARTLTRLLGGAIAVLLAIWAWRAGQGGMDVLHEWGYAGVTLAWCGALVALMTHRLHPLKAQRIALVALAAFHLLGTVSPLLLPAQAAPDMGALAASANWLLCLQQLFFMSYPPRRAAAWVLGLIGAQALPPLAALALGGTAAATVQPLLPLLLNHLATQAALLALLYTVALQIFKLAAWGAESPGDNPLHINELLARRTQDMQQLLDKALGHEAELRAMLDTYPGVVARNEEDTRFSYVNAHFAALFDRRPEDVLGMTMAELMGPYHAELAMARRARILATGQPQRYERSFKLPDGSVKDLLLTQFVVDGPPGVPRRHYAIGIDISDRKRAEQAQAQAARQAERANRAKSEFLSHVSHELRTPLNGVLGFAQLLRSSVTGLQPRERQWLRTMEHSSRHLVALMDEVLDHSRIEAGEMRVRRDVVDLADLANQVRETVQAAAGERGIEVFFRCHAQHARAWGDALRVRQVLLNLASNAVKYNRPEGRIEIVVEAAGESLRVSVADEGPGLSPAQLGQLFTPYERLGAEGGCVQGTGIGLTIARKLARLMGGDIEVRSEVGAGSCFSLVLPPAPLEQVQDDTPTTDFSALEASPQGSGYRMLYVEDNEVNRLVFEACLARRPGVQLQMAHDGAQAMKLAGGGGFDLIVLDLNLPDVTGLELARALRASPAQRQAQLALLTADVTSATLQAARNCGIERVWRKPFDVAELLAQIDAALAPA